MLNPELPRFLRSARENVQKAVAISKKLIYDIGSLHKEAMELSEPKLVSPLLDGFIIGEAISDHHGVRCYPAMRENTDERYIVKIISIPASQVQLDALLLSGAYSNEGQALDYFHELAQGVTGEADILDRLSRLEGFAAYLGHQIRQMDGGVGYEVYLLSKYERSLEKQLRTEPLTHLAAVNLGLDMCAALTACRRAGFLYADLKPGNIFLSDTQGYQIGDLGFISLSSLKYASLPEKYRSIYTAPEITDAMSALNDTIDIYALGLTLYQVYNNGELPFESCAPAQLLPPPMYADYEMAEIILKACSPEPKNRWQDPAQMGQALVNYMQRNRVNDISIVPAPVMIEDEPEEVEAFLTEEENDAQMAPLLDALPEEEPPIQNQQDDEVQTDAALPIDTDSEPDPEEDAEQLSFLDIMSEDETAPSEENAALLEDTPVTDEVAQMLAQADDLIAHELPEPVVAPAPIDVPIPPPIVIEPVEEEVPTEANDDPVEDIPDEDIEQTKAPETADEASEEINEPEETPEQEIPAHKPAGLRRWIAAAVVALLLVAAGIGGYFWYNEFYLQNVEQLQITYRPDQIHVSIISDIDDDLLTVVCTDTYGNTRRSSVAGGNAIFDNPNPGTQYRISLEISGLHKLSGVTTGTCTTPAQTEILNFSAVAGAEDGSVILNFTVSGPDTDHWTIVYGTANEQSQTVEFRGHSVTITGLTVGSDYTFRLLGTNDINLSGTYQLNYTAQKVITAQDLKISACGDDSMTLQWALPDGVNAQNWIVRCYNDAGYDQTLTTDGTSITLTGLDHSTGYTVLVTAEGMTSSSSIEVSPNPIHVTGYTATVNTPWSMTLSWDFTGATPENGWLLTFIANEGAPATLTCATNSAEITLFPGCSYTFEVHPADEVTYFTTSYSYGPVEANTFSGYTVNAENMSFSMCRRPDKQNWTHSDLKDSDYTNTFTVGEAASFLVNVNKTYDVSEDTIVTSFVIRGEKNSLISTDETTARWKDMWYKRYCELDIPQLPAAAGSYFIDIYFNGMYVTTQPFTIT